MTPSTVLPVPRPFAAPGAAAHAETRGKPEGAATLPGDPGTAPRASADARRSVPARAGARPGAAPRAVEARGNGRPLGPGGGTGLLCMLDDAVWGGGLATEGAGRRGAATAAFGPPGVQRVLAPARPDDAAALAVVRKPGMLFEGGCRAFGLRGGRHAAHPPPPGGRGACTTC